jgi:hypothetical protein
VVQSRTYRRAREPAARRYVAVRATPKYLATYECDTVDDLATPAYLDRLANQTPWSQSVMARFTHFTRFTLRIQADRTHGVGGVLATVRFVPDPRRRKALVEWLSEQALPKLIARPGLLGAAVGENDLEVAHAPLQDKSMDHPKAEEAEWIALIEGTDVAAVGAATRAHPAATPAVRRRDRADDRHLALPVRQPAMTFL